MKHKKEKMRVSFYLCSYSFFITQVVEQLDE